MSKKKKRVRNRRGMQAVTLCISTTMVLVLLGMVVFFVLSARHLSAHMKENLTVTVMLKDSVTVNDAHLLCRDLYHRPYSHNIDYKDSRVSDISYMEDLMDKVNANLRRVSIILLVLAVLLTFVSFSLISNTVRLSIYARRFVIHTMKLVGASWGFIRRPFLQQAIGVGVVAALLANGVLGAGVYGLYLTQPGMLDIVTWDVLAITAGAVFLFGILITAFCAWLAVNKFLRMKASELYKI